MSATSLNKTEAAILARRTSFGVKPALVNSLVGLSRKDAVEKVLGNTAKPGNNSRYPWIDSFKSPDSGIADRMTLFWHNLIPISEIDLAPNYVNKIPGNLASLRKHSVGNYRALMHEIVEDAGLILYLNGNTNNTVKGFNENLARELMELFTIGPGHYSQKDVGQAALAMSGWTGAGTLNRNEAYKGAITLFSETRQAGQADSNWNVHTLVDTLLNKTETANRISNRLWYYMVGNEGHQNYAPPADLGSNWLNRDKLDIVSLLRTILMSDSFWATQYSRARTGLEYYAALADVLNLTANPNKALITALGQMPYRPPNVAGWARDDSSWLSYGSDLRIGKALFDLNLSNVSNATDAIFEKCGIQETDPKTYSIVDGASGENKLRLALVSPEFRMQ